MKTINTTKPKLFILALLMCAVSTGRLHAQDAGVNLPAKTMTRGDVLRHIEQTTDNRIVYSMDEFDESQSVTFRNTSASVRDILDAMLEGSGFIYSRDGRFIVIHRASGQTKESVVTLATFHTMTGTVLNSEGEPIEGVIVELTDVQDKSAVTFANGRFGIEGVPVGSHIVKLTWGEGSNVRYREVNVRGGGDTDVELTFNEQLLTNSPQPDSVPLFRQGTGETKTTAYFVPNLTDHTIRAFSDSPKTETFNIPTTDVGSSNYMPYAAVKTNVLYLGTATLNLAVEIALARKWTLDVSAAYNPFQLEKGGINRLGFVQPEVRYWFCQRFEKHAIGLHGIYGRFNLGDVTFLTKTFEENRYKGWAAGAGISYIYHLPVARRWALEFTVGAGYLYIDYDKFRCYECDEFLGNRTKHYFGPTKAGISVLFMIK